jgi:hypothetical protein
LRVNYGKAEALATAQGRITGFVTLYRYNESCNYKIHSSSIQALPSIPSLGAPLPEHCEQLPKSAISAGSGKSTGLACCLQHHKCGCKLQRPDHRTQVTMRRTLQREACQQRMSRLRSRTGTPVASAKGGTPAHRVTI